MKFEYDVFLSYSHKDKEVVHRLAERLKQDGLSVWLDEWRIGPGGPILSHIENGLEKSQVCILLLSGYYNRSRWGKFERNVVITRDPNNEDGRFVFLKLDKCKVSDILNAFLIIDYQKEGENEYRQLLGACKPGMFLSSVVSRGKYLPDNDKNKDQGAGDETLYLNDCETFQCDTDKRFKKLMREIAVDLVSSSKVMSELEFWIAKEGGDNLSTSTFPLSAKRDDLLTARLINLDFNKVKVVLLKAWEKLFEDGCKNDVVVIEKVSRKLLPWHYVVQLSKDLLIDLARGKVGVWDDVLGIPAATTSLAAIILAGLDQRDVVWESLNKFPDGEYGLILSKMMENIDIARTDEVLKSLQKGLLSKIEIPKNKGIDDGQVNKMLHSQMVHLFEKERTRYYLICDVHPDRQQDKAYYKKILKEIRKSFPLLAIIELVGSLDDDQKLFNEIRHLLVPVK
ncbi:MAG: toll/interleukin-1 receptor domain-containing protein [Magnetococcus sp. DMHC-1]